MDFYQIKPTWEARQWNLGLLHSEEQITNFNLKYKESMKVLWDLSGPLNLLLWYQDLDNPNFKNLGFVDVLEWKGDVMHDPPLIGKPMANFVVISQEIYQILQKKEIPEHKFHPLNIRKEDSGEIKQFYALQLINTTYDEIDYKKSRFLVWKDQVLIEEYSTGEISSKDDYRKILKEQRLIDNTRSIFPDRLVFKKKYNVICSLAGEILFDQKIINEIEELGFQGIDISIFNQYTIEMEV